jgi:hypothetical protein
MNDTAHDFGALAEIFRAEIDGLTGTQLDWDDSSKEWSEWSIRRQVSHVALAYFFWIVKGWGKKLWPDDPPADPVDFSKAAVYDRRLDEEKFWRLEDLMPKFEEALTLAASATEGRTPEEMDELTLERAFKPELMMGKTELPVYQFWAYAATFHMEGLDQHADDETAFTFSLAGMLRHLYWEALVHLRTIQRLKIAQGLSLTVQIPREGYLLDPFFWGPGDEPALHPTVR